jgi:hypothetical protein
VRVDLLEAGLVHELDDEHGRQRASKQPRRSRGSGIRAAFTAGSGVIDNSRPALQEQGGSYG